MSRITYEWCCEWVHIESGDRDDLYFCDSFDDALTLAIRVPGDGYTHEIGLWRREWSRVDPVDLKRTEYAYLLAADGSEWRNDKSLVGARLPETFDGSSIKVPQRFHDEVQKRLL